MNRKIIVVVTTWLVCAALLLLFVQTEKIDSFQYQKPTHNLLYTPDSGGAVYDQAGRTWDEYGCTKNSVCTQLIAEGESVTLTATPAPGHFFAGWEWEDELSATLALTYAEANCSGYSGVCTFTMQGAMSIKANFKPVRAIRSVL